jgi:hypothetical protein
MTATTTPQTVSHASADSGGFLRNSWQGWPLERMLFVLSATITGSSAILAALVSPWFGLLTGFVAVDVMLFAVVGNCPGSLILRHVFGVKSGFDR